MGRLDCIVDTAVVEVLVLEVVVEVARQVDDEPWLLACFDDDVQRLNTEAIVGEVGVGGQLCHGTELHVLAQTSAHVVSVVEHSGRIGVSDSGWHGDQRQTDALSDVCLDNGQLA